MLIIIRTYKSNYYPPWLHFSHIFGLIGKRELQQLLWIPRLSNKAMNWIIGNDNLDDVSKPAPVDTEEDDFEEGVN